MDHQFPIVLTGLAGRDYQPLRMTHGIDADGEPADLTILWKWSAGAGTAYPLVTVPGPPEPIEGNPGRWRLRLGPDADIAAAAGGPWEGVVHAVRRPSASCCGDPMKTWRPPFRGAQRTEA